MTLFPVICCMYPLQIWKYAYSHMCKFILNVTLTRKKYGLIMFFCSKQIQLNNHINRRQGSQNAHFRETLLQGISEGFYINRSE